MASLDTTCDMNQTMKQAKVVVKATHVPEVKARIWIGCQIFKLFARVLGAKEYKLEIGYDSAEIQPCKPWPRTEIVQAIKTAKRNGEL